MTTSRPRGRASIYSEELAQRILAELMEGKSLREVCKADGMPSEGTVRHWVMTDKEGFAESYRKAREIGYLMLADEILEIADDGSNDWMSRQEDGGGEAYVLNGEHVQRSRVRIDARKWTLSKMLPKIFGDKVSQEFSGPDGGPIQHNVTHIELVPLTSGDDENTD